MKFTVCSLLFGLAIVAGASRATAQPLGSVETVKSELQSLMTELNAAVKAKDRAALERIYADDFLFIHALAGPVDKKDHIAAALASTPSAGLPIPSFDGLLVYGDVAILRRPIEGRFGTTIYVKKAGRWQILQLQGTATPPTKPSASVSPDVLRGYAGRYQQDNGLFVIISVEGDQLMLQVDGRQKLTLTAEAAERFLLPAGAGQITFTAAGAQVTYEIRRGNGSIVKGARVPPGR